MFDDDDLLDVLPLRNHLPPCQRTNDSLIFPDSVNSKFSNWNTHIPRAQRSMRASFPALSVFELALTCTRVEL